MPNVADEHATFHQLNDVRHANSVVHVRLRVVDDGGLRLREQIHFALVDMDAVCGDGARAEDFKFLQPFDHTFATVPQRPILITLRLGDVDVKARAQCMTEGRGLFHRGVGNRKRCVQPEERFHTRVALLLALVDKPSVLGQTFFCDARAVAIRQLVTKAGAQAGFAHGSLNSTERTDDRLWTGMMIN